MAYTPVPPPSRCSTSAITWKRRPPRPLRAHANAVADHVPDRDGDDANLEIGDRDHGVVHDRAEYRRDKTKQAGPASTPHPRGVSACWAICVTARCTDRLPVDVEILVTQRSLTRDTRHALLTGAGVRRHTRNRGLELQRLDGGVVRIHLSSLGRWPSVAAYLSRRRAQHYEIPRISSSRRGRGSREGFFSFRRFGTDGTEVGGPRKRQRSVESEGGRSGPSLTVSANQQPRIATFTAHLSALLLLYQSVHCQKCPQKKLPMGRSRSRASGVASAQQSRWRSERMVMSRARNTPCDALCNHGWFVPATNLPITLRRKPDRRATPRDE